MFDMNYEFLYWYNKNYPIQKKSINDLKKDLNYKKIKESYRFSGHKLSIDPDPIIIEVLKEARNNYFDIWIVTSRPNVGPNHENTRTWLDRNSLIYDRLIFCRTKESLSFSEKAIDFNKVAIVDDQKKFLRSLSVSLLNLKDFKSMLLVNYKSSHFENKSEKEQKLKELRSYIND